MNYLFPLLICFCFPFLGYSMPESKHVTLALKIRNELEHTLPKKYKIKVISESAGLADSVNILGLGFQIKSPQDKDTLRSILINCVESFKKKVNENEEIRPYLQNYPFSENNIYVDLFVVDNEGNEAFDPEISSANARKGMVLFFYTDRMNKFSYSRTEKESYEEAYQIVKSQGKLDSYEVNE